MFDFCSSYVAYLHRSCADRRQRPQLGLTPQKTVDS
jgi:hypothetical protein